MIVVGLSSSVLFIGFSGTEPIVRYQNLKFKQDSTTSMWTAKINGKIIAVNFPPPAIENILVEGTLGSILQNKLQIDTTTSINATAAQTLALAQHDFGRALSEYGVYVRSGFTKNNTYGLPIINCSTATGFIPVIEFVESNETKIIVRENCILAYAANQRDIFAVKDRMLYSALGVLK